MIYKVNEMKMNDEMNELGFLIWNEWDELWHMKWMSKKELGKYVTMAAKCIFLSNISSVVSDNILHIYFIYIRPWTPLGIKKVHSSSSFFISI